MRERRATGGAILSRLESGEGAEVALIPMYTIPNLALSVSFRGNSRKALPYWLGLIADQFVSILRDCTVGALALTLVVFCF
jgi:hypothetical protein